MTDPVARVDAAAANLRAMFAPTPLQRNDYLSDLYQADIWLKREDLSPVRSYKLRGAFTAMQAVIDAGGRGPFVCASAGNHAQGLAYACRHFDVPGVVYMPVTTPQQKIDKTRVFGGARVEIRLEGDYFDQTLASARRWCDAAGGCFVPPFDHPDIIRGQATLASELAAQMAAEGPGMPDMIVLPVGGGGLAAGVTQYLGQTWCEYVFVEPAGAPSLARALEAGAPVTLARVDNFVDGAAVARIGDLTFAALKGFAPDTCLAVPEDRLCMTMIEVLNHEGIVLEPAGALSIDALRDLRGRIKGRTVVCVISGGNFDFERLPDVKERALRHAGLKKYFILRMPQRPGALREFLNLLGPDDDIARFEYLKKSARNFGSVLIGIETRAPGAFDSLNQRVAEAGFSWQDITSNEMLSSLIL